MRIFKLFQKENDSQSKSQKRRADYEATSFYEEFSVRCHAPHNRSAVTTLLKCMGSGVSRSPDETINPVTLFETIATLRGILRTVALELNPQSDSVRLLSDTSSVMLGSVEGESDHCRSRGLLAPAVARRYCSLSFGNLRSLPTSLCGKTARSAGLFAQVRRRHDICGVIAIPNTEIGISPAVNVTRFARQPRSSSEA